MTDFKELSKPDQDAGGWYVATDTPSSNMRWLVNDGSNTLGDIDHTTGSSHLYFEDELNAHLAAAGYYRDQGKPYPHIRRWETLAEELHVAVEAIGVVLGIDPAVIESQVMEFE